MASDEDLMANIALGDESAVEVLMARYDRRLVAFLWRQTGGRDVEDLFQETWIRVVRGAGGFDPKRKFSTWLFQIGINLARDWHRRRPPEPVEVDNETERGTSGTPNGDPSGVHSDDPTAAPSQRSNPAGVETARIEAALDAQSLLVRLSPEHRDIVELRYFQDLSEAEASEVLNIPPGTAKSRLYHALKKLAEFLRETPLHTIPR